MDLRREMDDATLGRDRLLARLAPLLVGIALLMVATMAVSRFRLLS